MPLELFRLPIHMLARPMIARFAKPNLVNQLVSPFEVEEAERSLLAA